MSTAHSNSNHAGHEESDVSLRPVIWSGIGISVTVVLIAVAMWGMFRFYLNREQPVVSSLAAANARHLPPEPRLQSEPIKDLQQLHAEEDELLEHYGWVDKAAGTLHIPIARAMELTAKELGSARAEGAK